MIGRRRRRSGIQRLTASSKRLQVLIDRKSLTSTTGKERKYPEEFIRYFFSIRGERNILNRISTIVCFERKFVKKP